jgi:phosphomannomutase
MGGIFKAYDIRGIYGKTLSDATALAIGRAFVTFLGCKKVVVGRDIRTHSNALFAALSEGLTLQGADVIDVGLCSTPMSYYANGLLEADASIMITASHNPAEWNGFKLCREQAIPISGATGIADIERIVNAVAFAPAAQTRGVVSETDFSERYSAHVAKFFSLSRPVRIVADYANAMGIVESCALRDLIQIDPLYEELDGSFPNHEANPLKTETMDALSKKVASGSYDFGVAFDGDADRAGFVDEHGNIVPMDIVSAIIAQSILQRTKGVVLYDLRSSWAVKEVIRESGGTPIMCRVGHAFIKREMREHSAVFAGELSGHYYFRDNYYTESSAMAVLSIASIISNGSLPLSEVVRPIRRYYASGEINSEVADSARILSVLRDKYSDGRLTELDGISIEYDDWWFNVRSSNTEPLIRLNTEACTPEMMVRRRDELLAVIRS